MAIQVKNGKTVCSLIRWVRGVLYYTYSAVLCTMWNKIPFDETRECKE